MRSLPHWGATVLLAAPASALALGLGDIELQSALNQPFEAEIRLLSATPEELAELKVGLASRETFERYGLDRSVDLSALQFRVDRNDAGQSVIRVTSRQSIADPFLTMLVEATWPRGRLLREYTVLLDPPLFTPELGAEPPVRQAEASAPRSETGGAIARAPQATRPAPLSGEPQPAPASRLAAAAAGAAGGTYGPVQNAETLWGISSALLPDGVSVNQMMVAIYEANPRAFDANMNLLRRGSTLTIPERDRLIATTAAAATAEVRRHNETWQSPSEAQQGAAEEPQQARLRLVPPTAEAGSATAGAAASPAGAGSSSAAGDAESAAEVERLEGEVAALRGELEDSRRLLEIRDQQLQDLQAQLGAEQQPAEEVVPAAPAAPGASPGIDLESEQLFVDEPGPAAAEGATPGEPAAAAGPVEPEPAAAPAAVAPEIPAASATAATTPPEPSLLSRVLGLMSTPLLWIGLGVGAMLLSALWYLRHRREEVEDVTGRWEALEAEADDEGVREAAPRRRVEAHDQSLIVEEQPRRARADLVDTDVNFGGVPAGGALDLDAVEETLSSQTVINLDQADSLAEADFHMAYGLYDQAAELVSKALETEPHRRDLKLKLLEVFFVWGNKDAFLHAARDFRAETGGESGGDWDKVLIMGKQICPDEPMFAESAGGGAVDLDLQGDGSTALDFAFDDKDASGVHLSLDTAASSLDLELAATGERLAGSSDDDDEDDDRFDLGDSLDIGAQTAAGLEAALFEDDEEAGSDDNAFGAGYGEDDTGAATTPGIELDGLAVTQESAAVERPGSGLDEDWSAFSLGGDDDDVQSYDAPTVETPTIETPTVEAYGPDAPTVETPTLETIYGGTARMRSEDMHTAEMPTVEQTGIGASEHTEEIDLDDLGLSLEDLAGLPADIGELPRAAGDADTREQPTLTEADDDLLSATGVTQVLEGDDDELEQLETSVLSDRDATMLAPGYGDDRMGGTEVLQERREVSGDTSLLKALQGFDVGGDHGGNGLDLDLEDLAAALESGDTVEQPRSSFESEIFGANGSTPIDLDIGLDFTGSDDPTGTEDISALDPHTMTEIGTKLDLARAYIDMGDPEGARSILEEVLDEGDAGQRREAQGLIDVLRA